MYLPNVSSYLSLLPKISVVMSQTLRSIIETNYNIMATNIYNKAIHPKLTQLICKKQLHRLTPFKRQKAIIIVVIENIKVNEIIPTIT